MRACKERCEWGDWEKDTGGINAVDSWARVTGVNLRKRSHGQCHPFISSAADAAT